MLLFLDVVSPIPEICIIEENKLVFSEKIISKESEKLSDNIFQTYLKLNKELNLSKNLTKIAITNGPGSYTSLRVGSAFVSGLKISQDLLIYTISAHDIIKFKSEINKTNEMAIFIYSANNQKFLCTVNSDKEAQYEKLEDDNIVLPKNINNLYYNYKKLSSNQNINQNKFSFIDEFLNNIEKISCVKNKIIKPIYISNNIILN